MGEQHRLEQAPLTARIQAGPAALLQDEVLDPQFNYELRYLHRWYILIEKVQLLEYAHLDLLERETVSKIGSILDRITPETLVADPQANMSDMAFSIERYVEQQLDRQVPAWHVDRSRNDYQACAQVMFGRDQLFELVESLFIFAQAIHQLARRNTDVVMPGYTHYQAAQVISPGFYLTALSEQVLRTLHRLLNVYDDLNRCPLGSGAMAGQQLPWDRYRMANLLGFNGPQRHALIAVASREWILQIASELSIFSVTLSRFVTDFIYWGSSEYRFIDLPDELSGISSAMPQKKNFPILERIRGKTAHISAFYIDFQLGQRNTSYTNLVEVSKEGGSHLISLFTTMQSILRLFTGVIKHVQFRVDRMRAACEREYVGGFTLANFLTLHEGIPYRIAQVITGRYIVMAMERKLKPWQVDRVLLQSAGKLYGYEVNLSDGVLRDIFNVDHDLHGKQSVGSTTPAAVSELLAFQEEDSNRLVAEWDRRQVDVENACREVDTLILTQGGLGV